MRLYLPMMVLVVAAGCSLRPGSPKATHFDQWEHREDKTKTRVDFDRDLYECRRDNPSVRRQIAGEMRDHCLAAKGWRRR